MAANNRIYYPIQQLSIKAIGDKTYYPIRGVQSVGITTNFNLIQVFELGQLSLYENVEDIPDIQITVRKMLDGTAPAYCVATKNATTPTLPARAATRCNVVLGIYNESLTSSTGAPIGAVESTGMYISSVRYQFPVDTPSTEEITLVGNDKLWVGDTKTLNTWISSASAFPTSGAFDGTDLATNWSPVGIVRRQDIIFTGGAGQLTTSGVDTNGMILDVDNTILPPDVAGVNASGLNEVSAGTQGRAHIRNISISTTLNRDNFTELGMKAMYFRAPVFPTEVTTEIEIIATSGDMVGATASGVLSNPSLLPIGLGDSGNLRNRTIRIATTDGLRVYAGTRNKLASVNYNGGDAGGGHVNISYTFHTYNDFVVMHSGETRLTGISGQYGTSTADLAGLVGGAGAGAGGCTGWWFYRGSSSGYLIN